MQPRRFKRSLIAALVVPALAVPGAVLAQQAAQPQEQPQAAQQQQAELPIELGERDKRASRLIGMDVRSPQDENLGEIRDLVINTRTGNVEYVALAHGGVLGLGEDLYAYPLERFELAPDRDQVTLNATRGQLEQAQGFDSDDWPKVRADRSFWDRVTANFGDGDRQARTAGTVPQQRQPAAEQPVQFVRASEIEGEQLRDKQGGKLGEIADLIVSMEQGEVRYAIVDTEGDDRMAAVSMDEVRVRRDNGGHVVEYTKDNLDLSKSFSQAQWREFNRDPRAAVGGTLDPANRAVTPAAPAGAEPTR
jgi:sporulation protein YlmC with PRC-barrel domain